MTTKEIRDMQIKIGVTPDGFWGPKSIEACKRYITGLMPKNNPWPKKEEVYRYFGFPGEDELVNINAPVPMYLYDTKTPVKTIRCHKLVANSLSRALVNAYDKDPKTVERYFGCYEYRLKRGGSVLSMHAWGVAIDLSATQNRFKANWPLIATMPLSVIEEFAKEGWTSAAVFWGYDAMHFQATKP